MLVAEVNADMVYDMVKGKISREGVKRLMCWYEYEYRSFDPNEDCGYIVLSAERILHDWKEFLSPKCAVHELETNPRTDYLVRIARKELGEDAAALNILVYLMESHMLNVLLGCENGNVLVENNGAFD